MARLTQEQQREAVTEANRTDHVVGLVTSFSHIVGTLNRLGDARQPQTLMVGGHTAKTVLIRSRDVWSDRGRLKALRPTAVSPSGVSNRSRVRKPCAEAGERESYEWPATAV
jgi:hypothetical protein